MRVGIPILSKEEGMTYNETMKFWVSNVGDYDLKTEYLKFEEGTPFPEILSEQPHVAHKVDDLDHYAALTQQVISGSLDLGPGARLALVIWGDAIIEFYEEKQEDSRMLVSMNQVLQYAGDRRCCIGAFDIPNLEILMAVLETAEKRGGPAIIQHAQLHEYEMSIDVIGPIMVRTAEDVQVPVYVMLNHGEDTEYVKRAPNISFSVVTYDGSSLSYEENVRMTEEVVALAKTAGADVEAEIGIMTRYEGRGSGLREVSEAYMDPDLATRYIKDAGIDTLTASVGIVHGFYTAEPNLDFGQVVKIRELTGVPLVMRDGSGISMEGIQKAIRCGIRKINYSLYISNTGARTVKKLLEEKEVKYFHDLAKATADTMEADVLEAMVMLALE